jgi:hypothetical protein
LVRRKPGEREYPDSGIDGNVSHRLGVCVILKYGHAELFQDFSVLKYSMNF